MVGVPAELRLMFSLMNRIAGGVEPMLRDLEAYIVQSGLDDMKANADIITTVSGWESVCMCVYVRMYICMLRIVEANGSCHLDDNCCTTVCAINRRPLNIISTPELRT